MAHLGLSSPILWPTPRRLLAPARRFYLSDTETAQSASLPGMAFRTDPIPSRSSRDTTPGYVIGDALQQLRSHRGARGAYLVRRSDIDAAIEAAPSDPAPRRRV